MIHDYKAARSICGFVEFCAWAAVVVAALVALMAIGAASSSRGGAFALTGLIPAFTLALAGLIVIVMVQMARATMDGSVAAQKNVVQSQKQHEELMQSLRSYVSQAPAAGSMTSRATPSDTEEAQMGQIESVARSADGAVVAPLAQRPLSSSPSIDPPSRLEYKGQVIQTNKESYVVGEIHFAELDQAKQHVDRIEDERLSKEIRDRMNDFRKLRGY